MFPVSHIELCKNPKGALEYCLKEDTRIDGPWEFGEPTKKMAGKTQKINKLKDLIPLSLEERIESLTPSTFSALIRAE